MIVLDTTVLVYAKGSAHSLRDPCRELIEAVADARIEATTTVEAIQEFVHVRSRRLERAEAAGLGAALADLLAPLLQVSAEELRAGLSAYERHERLGCFDAVLAAAASAIEAEALVSADRAFATLQRPRHVFPDADGIAALLGPTS